MEGEQNLENTTQKSNENEATKSKIEKLNKMLDEITFSDSDSDIENNNPNKQKFILSAENYSKEMSKINNLYDFNIASENQMIEEGVDEGTMNNYTGTKHEIINEKDRKDFPIPYIINDNDNLEICGYIKEIVEKNILMCSTNNNINQIINLDNIIFNEKKEAIGFVDDVIGQIDLPIYVIKIYPNLYENFSMKKDDKLFYCKNKVNLINGNELKNKNKGCDASNAFDEEVSDGEKDYSDDEEEINAKILRKQKRKNKKMKIEENEIKKENNNNINNNLNNKIENIGNNNYNNIVNAPYTFDSNNNQNNLNQQMEVFINQAINMNINPFTNPFQINNNNDNNTK